MIAWSRNRTDSEKIIEAAESQRQYNKILKILQEEF